MPPSIFKIKYSSSIIQIIKNSNFPRFFCTFIRIFQSTFFFFLLKISEFQKKMFFLPVSFAIAPQLISVFLRILFQAPWVIAEDSRSNLSRYAQSPRSPNCLADRKVCLRTFAPTTRRFQLFSQGSSMPAQVVPAHSFVVNGCSLSIARLFNHACPQLLTAAQVGY